MAEDFKVIETQEQLDAILKGRLERQKETLEKAHSEASAELQNQLKALESEKAELSKKVEEYDRKQSETAEKLADYEKKCKDYETDSVKTRIARECGIPYEMRDRLRGETEEELRKDAEAISKFISKSIPHKKVTEPREVEKNNVQSDLSRMLESMS